PTESHAMLLPPGALSSPLSAFSPAGCSRTERVSPLFWPSGPSETEYGQDSASSSHAFPRFHLHQGSARSLSGQPQPFNPIQDGFEDRSRDRHLSHLEGHVPCMRDD